MKKKIWMAAALAAVVLVAVLYRAAMTEPPEGPQGEIADPDEQALIAQMVPQAIAVVNRNRETMIKEAVKDQPFRRFAHAKAHSCVRANFKILDVPDRLRIGLFAKPAEYQAWIRLSNGDPSIQKDSKDDARGMAVKVMGVPGEKLLDLENDAQTQDFVMMNAPRFFVRDIREYALFMRYAAEGKVQLLRFFFPWNFLEWRPRDFRLLIATLGAAPDSILNAQFYSVSAYKLGAQSNVKYSARPCTPRPAPAADRSAADFLRTGLVKQLSLSSACFELLVQIQAPSKNMPVEDLTVEWKESDSPFVPVARMEIAQQEFDTPEQNAFCEGLSFTPWHALPEHRPIGNLNRARRALYLAVSQYRRSQMGVPVAEPQGWCLKVGAPCEPVPTSPR